LRHRRIPNICLWRKKHEKMIVNASAQRASGILAPSAHSEHLPLAKEA
jgi:hypothetical protein